MTPNYCNCQVCWCEHTKSLESGNCPACLGGSHDKHRRPTGPRRPVVDPLGIMAAIRDLGRRA
jgi:hypothetical protein